jgi:outer membrane lipoprotein-sorting protein
MSGATGRLWATNDGRGRLELQSSAGDAQIVWNPTQLTVYDASSKTVYKANLPTSADATSAPAGDTPPSLTEITSFLTDMSQNATVSDAQPDNVAGQPAYTVSISPKHDGGLLGSAQLAWDAATGVPLRIAIYAQGSSTPALALEATNISYGAVASSDVDVAPPADATVVDLSGLIGGDPNSTTTSEPTGLPAVQSAVGFTVTAPDTLVGLPLQEVTAAGSDTAIAVYGQGLGAIVVSESKSADSSNSGGILSNLPTVSLDGTTAHELATQLGTAVEWDNQGITYVLAGSLPSAAAEAAARELPH